MATKVLPNPLDEAWNPPEQTSTYCGKITILGYSVMFVEDVHNPGKKMKVPYDASVLNADGSEPRPVSMIKVSLTPSNPELKYDVVRDLIVSSNEWAKITLPSIKTLGIMQLAELDGKFAEAEMAETGRTWVTNGETKKGTTFKFLRLFPDEASCQAAAGVDASPAVASPANPVPGNNGNGNSERETALKFLKAYAANAARAAGKDLAKAQVVIGPMIAQQALLSKYFTANSPEVLDLLTAECIPF